MIDCRRRHDDLGPPRFFFRLSGTTTGGTTTGVVKHTPRMRFSPPPSRRSCRAAASLPSRIRRRRFQGHRAARARSSIKASRADWWCRMPCGHLLPVRPPQAQPTQLQLQQHHLAWAIYTGSSKHSFWQEAEIGIHHYMLSHCYSNSFATSLKITIISSY